MGHLTGLDEMRAVARASCTPVHYHPVGERRGAEATYRRFLEMTGLGAPGAAHSSGRWEVNLSERAAIEARVAALEIETPSWGYGDSGTRFAVFPQRDRPRNVFERVDDAAVVHRLTGIAPAVALHFPWDRVDDLAALRDHIAARGLRAGAINANLFQDPDYRLGSLTNRRPGASARRRSSICWSVSRSPPRSARPRSRLWLADGINYAGQDDFRERRRRLAAGLAALYAALPPEQELLVEYKPFEPAFYATDLADWGSALLSVPLPGGAGARARRSRTSLSRRERRADRGSLGTRGAAGGHPSQRPQVRRRRPDRRVGRTRSSCSSSSSR